jgi:SAM-dependent methyltransferase
MFQLRRILAKLLLRHGEGERIKIVRRSLPPLEGRSVLDAGCGNGACLSCSLNSRPRSLHLEDTSELAVTAAANKLAGSAETLSTAVADSFQAYSAGFDVILGIGLLDYQSDLTSALQRLVTRSSGMLLVTVPRGDKLRNWVRYVWFTGRGKSFQLVSRRRLLRVASGLGESFVIERGPYEWFLKMSVRHRWDDHTPDVAEHPGNISEFRGLCMHSRGDSN